MHNSPRLSTHPYGTAPTLREQLWASTRLSAQARMNGGTNIALSIQQAGQLLKDEDPQAARIIVLLTDGRVDAFQGKPLRQA